MNSLRYLRFALILLIASSLSAQITPVLGDQRPWDRDAIRNRIEKIFDAYIHKDRDVIRGSHATDWRGYISLSRQIIRGIDQYMQASDNVQKLAPMLGYKILDFDTVFYSDVAVVPYIAQVDLNIGGAPITSKLRVLVTKEEARHSRRALSFGFRFLLRFSISLCSRSRRESLFKPIKNGSPFIGIAREDNRNEIGINSVRNRLNS